VAPSRKGDGDEEKGEDDDEHRHHRTQPEAVDPEGLRHEGQHQRDDQRAVAHRLQGKIMLRPRHGGQFDALQPLFELPAADAEARDHQGYEDARRRRNCFFAGRTLL
jgi:hypothetical protein